MKQLLALVRKEFYHIFRDRRTMLILLVMPVIQIILFGFALTNEIKNAPIAVLDLSKDAATQRIISRFQASRYFSLVAELGSAAEVDNAFKQGAVSMVVVFSESFQSSLQQAGGASVQLIADATDPNQATMLTGYASSILMQYRQELMQQHSAPMQIHPQLKMLYNPQMKSAYNFVPGVMGLILMLICAMMTSVSIVREKEVGTMEVLLASPVSPIYLILAKAVPYFALSFVNLITILLLSVFVLNVPVAGSLLLLTLVSLLIILVALSLGLLISNLVGTQVAAMLASGLGLMMPTMVLTGMIFPVESMPQLLQWISAAVPARWYIDAVKKLMVQGVDGIYVLKHFAILLLMAFALIFVSLKRFKTRL
jgi:ABC-2 type transport system permease protein